MCLTWNRQPAERKKWMKGSMQMMPGGETWSALKKDGIQSTAKKE